MTLGAGHKILIANRGEIAVRISRAVFEAGWTSVAAAPADDPCAPHLAHADERVALPGSGARAYLDAGELIRAALATGCTMVHPGYGFLSEDASFAQACSDAGLTFIGPSPETLRAFGDKPRSRAIAEASGAPVPRGSGVLESAADAERFMTTLGGPIMLKAASGGGGRGIRIIREISDIAVELERCRSEARKAFGDDRVFAEEMIDDARHVEVQVAGDGTGAVAVLGERECSLQRRQQKVVEFAPAAGLSRELRGRLFEAAQRIAASVGYRGLGTVEFLVSGDAFRFLEVNPRIQVEHTVTEAVSGVDLVALQLRLAAGGRLTNERLPDPFAPSGMAVQLRVNAERMLADGDARPASGAVSAFDMPSGPGVRVDTVGYAGRRVTVDYDPLLAKLIIHEPGGDREKLLRRACRALCETTIAGVATNLSFLRALVSDEAVRTDQIDVRFIDRAAVRILEAAAAHPSCRSDAGADADAAPSERDGPAALDAPDGAVPVNAETDSRVVELCVAVGDAVSPGQIVAVTEAMKMEFALTAPCGGTVIRLDAEEGAAVSVGAPLMFVAPDGRDPSAEAAEEAVDLDRIRADLRRVFDARRRLSDDTRPEAVARRRRSGQRTARENIDDLCDPESFHEYGGFALAAQRNRRSHEELEAMSPADGMVMGFGTVNADRFGPDGTTCAVIAYDYTVFAGTQGVNAHIKKNRLFRLVEKYGLPLVMFAEGGGGRPGDTDDHGFLKLYNPTFFHAARLKARTPVIAIVSGRCFAGNAALAACADVIIATRNASIGMGGPAMISGGGLGEVAAEDIGPVSMHGPNGVVDVIVEDEAEAVATARALLSCRQDALRRSAAPGTGGPDQRRLRHVIPEEPRRAYRMRDVIDLLADEGSVIELRPQYGVGLITAIARIAGHPFAIMANNPAHLSGALDAAASAKAAEFAPLVEKLGLPLLKLCDTPGFMVGPRAESEGLVRQAGRMFAAGAALTVPQFTVVVRKAYGLGALAMVFGNAHEQVFSVAWPSGHFGKMGLEGQVRLAYRRELEALPDDAAREAKLREMVSALHENGNPINAAAYLSIDDVIDPVQTRDWLIAGLRLAGSMTRADAPCRAAPDDLACAPVGFGGSL